MVFIRSSVAVLFFKRSENLRTQSVNVLRKCIFIAWLTLKIVDRRKINKFKKLLNKIEFIHSKMSEEINGNMVLARALKEQV